MPRILRSRSVSIHLFLSVCIARWWTVKDSNLGPAGYEPAALTNCANSPHVCRAMGFSPMGTGAGLAGAWHYQRADVFYSMLLSMCHIALCFQILRFCTLVQTTTVGLEPAFPPDCGGVLPIRRRMSPNGTCTGPIFTFWLYTHYSTL